MSLFQIKTRHKIGLLLGLTTLVLNNFVSFSSGFIESVYSRGLFKLYRGIYDHSFALSPIPLVYVLFGFLVFLCFRKFRKITYRSKQGILNEFVSLGSFIGYVLFVFYMAWGFNYQRVPIKEQMDLDLNPINLKILKDELARETSFLVESRPILKSEGDSITEADLPSNMEQEIRIALEAILAEYGYDVNGRVRVRQLAPAGILLRIKTAGVYIPFVGEGHIDKGLHPIQKPFTMAHEMAHGYGFGDEGTCNFLAYLACLKSKIPIIKYSGSLGYWKYLSSNLRANSSKDYLLFWENIPSVLKKDLNDIYVNSIKYPDLFPRLRDKMYNSYLKSQGISEGMQNYDRVILLVHSWQKKHGNFYQLLSKQGTQVSE